ncbi:MAG: HAMP domain-containing sensor histidine kinase [Pseudomonadota bacterium]
MDGPVTENSGSSDALEAEGDNTIALAAFSAMPMSAFLVDATGDLVLQTSRAAHRFAGPADAAGATYSIVPFSQLTGLETGILIDRFRAALPRGHITLPMRLTGANQKTKAVPFHLSLLRHQGGRGPLYMLAQDQISGGADALRVANDLRKREAGNAAALQAHLTELQRALLSMERFANAASHDLRTPINAITGLLDLFVRKFGDDLPDTAGTYLGHIQRAAEQLDTITDTLLTHARSAAAPLELQKLSVRDAVQQAVDGLAPRLRLQATGISVLGPNLQVMAEPALLRIMLDNLVSNALKHGVHDRPLNVMITSTLLDTGATLEIADTGRGFDPSKAEAIFAPFQRLNSDRGGTGIGLSTCDEICKRHGWRINAASDGESGAQFTIEFPNVLAL